ncbi:MAG: 50S ribosomal protein L19 [Candidatus Aureabacteria bacterium]|nr:50S ribosomal protein L19 [Candidatus Auribacterota bacterium]
MNPIIEKIEKENLKKSMPPLPIGSQVKVTTRIIEEGKERQHHFTGILIAKQGRNIRSSITVRRLSGNTSLERVFFIHSPSVIKIEMLRKGIVRKSKLYYLRGKIGKETRIEEKTE